MSSWLSDRDLLAQLISFDSTSDKSNLPIADFICRYFDGTQAEIFRNEREDGEKVNLVIRIGQAGALNARAGLILSGHMDVVPAGEPEWRSDPFCLHETNEAFYGRGTADMKGFVALAINVARSLADHPPLHPLVLILTFDEELGLLGARHLAQTWDNRFPLPGAAVVGEPTELTVVRMHKGLVTMRITLRGTAAHSAYPHLGKNAIEPAGRVLCALTKLREELERERMDTSRHFPEAPFPTLNVAQITGGSAMNVVPAKCVIGLSVRLLPGVASSELIKRIRTAIDGLGDLGDHAVEVTNDSPALLAPEDCAVHRELCRVLAQDGTRAVSYASDAGVLQQMGINTVLFGPGSIEVAHKPNECLPKDQFATAQTILQQVVREFCQE